MDKRITSGPAPAAARCSSVNCRCVVEAGCNTSERVVTDVGQMRKQIHTLDQFDAGFVPALEPAGEDRTGAFG